MERDRDGVAVEELLRLLSRRLDIDIGRNRAGSCCEPAATLAYDGLRLLAPDGGLLMFVSLPHKRQTRF